MKTKLISLIVSTALLPLASAQCAGIAKNNAKMQAMDKITGRVSVINVPVDGEVKFGSLSIVVRSCKTRPAEEAPDNFAFVDITDKNLKGDELNIFKGWMISSSPATHAVEHPIYDVWLLQCTDEKISKDNLLSAEDLAARDLLPMQKHLADNQSAGASEQASQDTLELSNQISEMENEEHISREIIPTEQQTEFFFDEEDSIDELNNQPE